MTRKLAETAEEINAANAEEAVEDAEEPPLVAVETKENFAQVIQDLTLHFVPVKMAHVTLQVLTRFEKTSLDVS
jgi:hypothetical protein